jgi:hypothetical protein
MSHCLPFINAWYRVKADFAGTVYPAPFPDHNHDAAFFHSVTDLSIFPNIVVTACPLPSDGMSTGG